MRSNSPNQYEREESNEYDRKRKKLEVQVDEMWRTINELQQKMAEEQAFINIEKNKSKTLMERRTQVRQGSSMFHLPSCPIRTREPCPVHPIRSYNMLPSEPQPKALGSYYHIGTNPKEEDIFHGHRRHNYGDTLQTHRKEIEWDGGRERNSFHNQLLGPTTPPTNICDSTDKFSLLMTNHWVKKHQSTLRNSIQEGKKMGKLRTPK